MPCDQCQEKGRGSYTCVFGRMVCNHWARWYPPVCSACHTHTCPCILFVSVGGELQLAACHLDRDFTCVFICPEMLSVLARSPMLFIVGSGQKKTSSGDPGILHQFTFCWRFHSQELGGACSATTLGFVCAQTVATASAWKATCWSQLASLRRLPVQMMAGKGRGKTSCAPVSGKRPMHWSTKSPTCRTKGPIRLWTMRWHLAAEWKHVETFPDVVKQVHGDLHFGAEKARKCTRSRRHAWISVWFQSFHWTRQKVQVPSVEVGIRRSFFPCELESCLWSDFKVNHPIPLVLNTQIKGKQIE